MSSTSAICFSAFQFSPMIFLLPSVGKVQQRYLKMPNVKLRSAPLLVRPSRTPCWTKPLRGGNPNCCPMIYAAPSSPHYHEGLILHTIVRERQHEHHIFTAIALRPAIPDTSQTPQAQGLAAQSHRSVLARYPPNRRVLHHQLDRLTEAQLMDYFTELQESHSWSTVNLIYAG